MENFVYLGLWGILVSIILFFMEQNNNIKKARIFGWFSLFILGFTVFLFITGHWVWGIIAAIVLFVVFGNYSGLKQGNKQTGMEQSDNLNTSLSERKIQNEPSVSNNKESTDYAYHKTNTKVDYKPIIDLCAELGNDTYNNYIPFNPFFPVKILYCDKDGETTSRDVDVMYIAKGDYNPNEYYFKAFCHLRNEDRTFIVDRIQQTIVDGETVDFVQYIVDTYRKTDKYKETVLAVKTKKLLESDDVIGQSAKILTYIARIDGILTRKEKTVIAAFLKEIAIDQPEIEIENYIDGLAELTPSTPEYKSLVKNIVITENLIEKAKEIAGKDPLRLGAFGVLFNQYEKNKPKN